MGRAVFGPLLPGGSLDTSGMTFCTNTKLVCTRGRSGASPVRRTEALLYRTTRTSVHRTSLSFQVYQSNSPALSKYPHEHEQQICPFLYCPLQWLLRELLVQLVENLHLMNCTDFAILVGRGAVAHSLTLPIRLLQAQERAYGDELAIPHYMLQSAMMSWYFGFLIGTFTQERKHQEV